MDRFQILRVSIICLISLSSFGTKLSSQDSPILAENLGANEAFVDGDHIFYKVFESFSNQNLNGDGDMKDLVLHYRNIQTGEVVNTRIAGDFLYQQILSNRWLILIAQEADQSEDLNGDSDMADRVLQVHDLQTQTTTNSNLAVSTVLHNREGTQLLLRISEEHQFEDLDGNREIENGKQTLHIYSLETGEIKNFGIDALFFLETETEYLFSIFESEKNEDYNQDGDRADPIFHFLDKETLELRNTQFSYAVTGAFRWTPKVLEQGEWLYFLIPERTQGVDFNSDGDQGDLGVRAYNVHSKEILEVAASSFNTTKFNNHIVAYVEKESIQQRDLNEDGDTHDQVTHIQNLLTGEIKNLKVAGFPAAFHNDFVIIRVSEGAQNEDLDEDGSIFGEVYFRYNLATDELTNLHLFGGPSDNVIVTEDSCLFLNQNEFSLKRDLNGDGDEADRSIIRVAPYSGGVSLFKDSNGDMFFDEKIYFWALEDQSDQDFNTDGDKNDRVLHELVCGREGFNNLELEGEILGHVNGNLLISETEGSEDLNGDGDFNDSLFYYFNAEDNHLKDLNLLGTQGWVHENLLILQISEPQMETDFNDDGAHFDEITHIYSLEDDILINTKDTLTFLGQHRNWFVGSISEPQKNQDLNGDGDKMDQVLHVFDLSTSKIYNLKSAASSEVIFTNSNQLIFPVLEEDQGFDLNGDGSISFDLIYHLVQLDELSNSIPQFIRGDCNRDGTVNLSDPIQTLVDLFLPKEGERLTCADACDSNDDGIVEIVDPVITLGYLFLGQGGIPLPGAVACGEDPTVDALSCLQPPVCAN